MPNTYELVVNMHDFSGNYFVNRFNYSLSEAGTASAWEYAKALADKWFTTGPFAQLQAILAADTFIDFITAKRITGLGGPSYTLIAQTFGGQANNGDTVAYAADVQWQSAAASNRPGHTYLGGLADGAILQGQWQAAVTAPIANFITAMLSALTLTGGLGTATFGHFTRKTKVFDANTHGVLRPKPTAMNKRTKPII